MTEWMRNGICDDLQSAGELILLPITSRTDLTRHQRDDSFVAKIDDVINRIHPMESSLETVALFSLKLAYETESQSPILRKDLIMSDYQKEVFGLLVRRGDVGAIRQKVDACVGLALKSLGGVDKPLGRELHKLSADFNSAATLEQLDAPLAALKGYLKDIQ